MIHKRSVRVSLVKDAAGGEAVASLTPEQINKILDAQVKNVALTVGTVLLAKKAADTLSELILIAGKKYI